LIGRRALWIAIAVIAALCGPAVVGYRQATSDPIVRAAQIRSPQIDQPFRILLISDTHVQAPDMTPARLTGILTRLDRLRPDLVLLAGDYQATKIIGRHSPTIREALAPFQSLHPRLGTVAVLGNHDGPAGPSAKKTFAAFGIIVLTDEAKQFGPVAVGGIWHRPRITARKLKPLAGPRILVAHRPDAVKYTPEWVDLFVAGHTHCGQIVLPVVGPLLTGSELPQKNTCGESAFAGRAMIVTAGLGTSHVPLRLGASPDVWLITLLPEPRP
jgi:predicted MPP superfamily phosphohydrolase